jgi:hypothetical protein
MKRVTCPLSVICSPLIHMAINKGARIARSDVKYLNLKEYGM